MLSKLLKRLSKSTLPTYEQRIFIPIRFSVLSTDKAWKIAESEVFEDYRKKLFSSERLNVKFRLFENVVVPNLKAIRKKSSVSIQVQLLISEELPDEYKKRLNAIIAGNEFIKVYEVGRQESVSERISSILLDFLHKGSSDIAYATVRLDDDDLLSHQFGDKISKYINPGFCGHIISYSKGFEAYVDLSKQILEPVIKISAPKIALGMAHINFYHRVSASLSSTTAHVYATGNHTQVQKNFSLILDQTPCMYVRMCYLEQDTEASNIFARIKRRDCTPSSAEEAAAFFPELKNLVI